MNVGRKESTEVLRGRSGQEILCSYVERISVVGSALGFRQKEKGEQIHPV